MSLIEDDCKWDGKEHRFYFYGVRRWPFFQSSWWQADFKCNHGFVKKKKVSFFISFRLISGWDSCYFLKSGYNNQKIKWVRGSVQLTDAKDKKEIDILKDPCLSEKGMVRGKKVCSNVIIMLCALNRNTRRYFFAHVSFSFGIRRLFDYDRVEIFEPRNHHHQLSIAFKKSSDPHLLSIGCSHARNQ